MSSVVDEPCATVAAPVIATCRSAAAVLVQVVWATSFTGPVNGRDNAEVSRCAVTWPGLEPAIRSPLGDHTGWPPTPSVVAGVEPLATRTSTLLESYLQCGVGYGSFCQCCCSHATIVPSGDHTGDTCTYWLRTWG